MNHDADLGLVTAIIYLLLVEPIDCVHGGCQNHGSYRPASRSVFKCPYHQQARAEDELAALGPDFSWITLKSQAVLCWAPESIPGVWGTSHIG